MKRFALIAAFAAALLSPQLARAQAADIPSAAPAIQVSGASSPPTNDRPSATSAARAFLTTRTASSASPSARPTGR